MGEVAIEHLHVWNGETSALAVRKAVNDRPNGPGFVWLGGFRSDMAGTKAETMVEAAAEMGCPSLRFDYSGHGESGGEFTNGTISRWVEESLSVFRAHTRGPQILVGSSMGGWIALRMAQELKKAGEEDRLAGLLLIAPAPDFTSKLMEPSFTDEQRAEMKKDGFILEPSEYSDEPNTITQSLIEDGRENCVLESRLVIGKPVRILQGMADPDVPYQHAMRLVEALPEDEVVISLVKGGDHRLSTPADLDLLRRTMASFSNDAPASA